MLQGSGSRIVRGFCAAYTGFFRGIPDLLALFIVYFGLQGLIDQAGKLLGLAGHLELHAMVAGVIASAKDDGSVTDAVSTDAFAHFCMMLATGALVLRGLGIDQPDPDDWHALVARLLDALSPSGLETQEKP